MSNSLWPHELQHARIPCPSLSPEVYSNLCPVGKWCPPIISSSVTPFSSCPQSSQHPNLFQWISCSHQVAKVLKLQLQHIIPYNEYSWLISFRIGWFDLLTVQGTLKSLPKHYSLKASVLQHSAFFVVQLLHPYMTTG